MSQIDLEIEQIRFKINQYNQEGKKLFASSSFQTHSIPMLHILSSIDKSIPIYFINTGFHFPETIEFRDKIADMFNLKLIDLNSIIPKNQQRDENGNLYFTSDPDYCCHLNKVQPMDSVLTLMDVWINGIRKDQNTNRKAMQEEEKTPQGALRYHPMLNWTSKMIFEYTKHHNLPSHPLELKGFLSIGCEPCTRKFSLEDDRSGRWYGMKKTECGLHTELVEKK